ncbi:hypothetical protein ACQZ6F_20545 [Rhizobium sp. A22-96]
MNDAIESTFSMNGLPWTSEKIAEAASQIRQGGRVGFAFGVDALAHLLELDARVFSTRPDLKLTVWTVASQAYSDEELNTLASLRNVKKLEMSGVKQKSLMPLANFTTLNALELKTSAPVDLSFLSSLGRLQELSLLGKFTELDAVAGCIGLQKLYLSTALASYATLAEMRGLRALTLDACNVPPDLSPLNQPALEYLHLSSIPRLDMLDALAGFSHLRTLKMRLPHLESLPDLSGMLALTHLDLQAMKKWDNPEIIGTLPNLASLKIWDINTKLRAERFAFLTSMPSLTKVDFRFIDDGKKRRDQIEAMFREAIRLDAVVLNENLS